MADTSLVDLFGITTPEQESDHLSPQLDALLLVEEVNDDIVNVKLKLSDNLEQSVGRAFHDGVAPTPQVLFRLNYKAGTVHIFPQAYFFRDDLYGPKYDKIREIQLRFDDSMDRAETHFGAIEFLKCLPSGFIKDPAYGLGVVRELRPIIYAIEKLPNVTRIEIAADEETHVNGNTFYFNSVEFEALKTGTNHITRRYQRESLRERVSLAHNATLHRVNPAIYPKDEKPYESGTIYKLLGGSKSGTTILKGNDRKGILAAVATNAAAIAERDPKEFIQLQKDIELVSLDKLITAYEQRLRRNSNEAEWQRLLEANQFILAMLFGHPFVVLQAGAAVGGQTIAGDGTKIADFLGQNPFTKNAAIVELKRPRTPLFGKEYRKNVFSPSTELTGTIVQILDQRHKLTTSIQNIAYNNQELRDLEVLHVDCVIVAGRSPSDRHKIASFELNRKQMKDVQIVTFDELLDRLKLLRELLTGDRYISEYDDTDDEFNADIDITEDDVGDGSESGWGDDPDQEDFDPRD